MPYEFTHQYPREQSDFYIEPEFCTDGLLDKVKFNGDIHDPANGTGTITRVALRHGYTVSSSDIQLRPGEYASPVIRDYLTDFQVYNNVVTNPPYNYVEEFAHHALKCTRYKIALLTRLAFLEGQRRYKNLYKPKPPSLVLVFAKRPSMPPYGQPVGGGKTAYCWVIWDLTTEHKNTELDWII